MTFGNHQKKYDKLELMLFEKCKKTVYNIVYIYCIYIYIKSIKDTESSQLKGRQLIFFDHEKIAWLDSY